MRKEGNLPVSPFPATPQVKLFISCFCQISRVGFLPLPDFQIRGCAEKVKMSDPEDLTSIKVRLEVLEALVRRIVRHVQLPLEAEEEEEGDQLEFNVEVKEEQELQSSGDEQADMEAVDVFANDDDEDIADSISDFEFPGNTQGPAADADPPNDLQIPPSFANPFVSLNRLPPDLDLAGVNVKGEEEELMEEDSPEADADPEESKRSAGRKNNNNKKRKGREKQKVPNFIRRNGRLSLPCYFCRKTIRSGARMTEHMATHTQERPFRCEVEGCSMSFYLAWVLRDHVWNIHTKEKLKYKCSLCEESFPMRQSLEAHVKRKHKDTRKECPVCKGIYRNAISLRSHMIFQHDVGPPKPQSQCPYCGVLMRPDIMKQHIKLHETNPDFKPRNRVKKQPNHNIPTSSSKEAAFAFDPDRVLESPIVIRCNFPPCELTFSTEEQRTAHERRNHVTGKLPCPICGKELKNYGGLQNHLDCVHKAERPFACGICGQRFKVKTHMTRHEKGHSKPGWKPRSICKNKKWEKVAAAEGREKNGIGGGDGSEELSNPEQLKEGNVVLRQTAST